MVRGATAACPGCAGTGDLSSSSLPLFRPPFVLLAPAGALLAAPEEARPAERPEPLGGDVPAGVFGRLALEVRVQALAAHLGAAVLREHLGHRAVLGVLEQDQSARAARGRGGGPG